MKKWFFIFTAIIFFSCNDGKSTTTNTSNNRKLDTIAADTLPPGNLQEERDALQTTPAEKPVAANIDKYRKILDDQPATDCNCNCIEITYERPTEWCIDKDKMYISVRSQRTGENTADVYFVAPSREISPDRQLPWKDFDTNSPVATVIFQADGSAKLDWLGFSKNGEIITEYALYGKKTLEGIYKKQ